MIFGQPKACLRKFVAAISLLMVATVVLATVASATVASAADKPQKKGPPLKVGQYNPAHDSVEMFEAIEAKQIDVKIIPKDSKLLQVMIENKSDKPLNIKLPSAFAGVPVLAQAGLGGGGLGGGGNNNTPQPMGGGMGMGMGMGGMGMGGMGGGMFNVAPEKVGKFKLTTVCLEHGKSEPRPAIPYEIKPIESYTDKLEVQELCRMIGTGKITQRAAQVAAWHLNSGMSFQQLAAKQLKFANGTSRPYFSPQEIRAGMQVTAMATKLAEQRKKADAKSDSLSQKK